MNDASTENLFFSSAAPIRPAEMGYSVVEAESIHRIFYSSLYRASIFPRQLTEYDAGQVALLCDGAKIVIINVFRFKCARALVKKAIRKNEILSVIESISYVRMYCISYCMNVSLLNTDVTNYYLHV